MAKRGPFPPRLLLALAVAVALVLLDLVFFPPFDFSASNTAGTPLHVLVIPSPTPGKHTSGESKLGLGEQLDGNVQWPFPAPHMLPVTSSLRNTQNQILYKLLVHSRLMDMQNTEAVQSPFNDAQPAEDDNVGLEEVAQRNHHNGNVFMNLIGCNDDHARCKENQINVVILVHPAFAGVLWRKQQGPEQEWALSIMQSLQNLGYSYFFAASLHQARAQYGIMGDLVKAVIGTSQQAADCLETKWCTKQFNIGPKDYRRLYEVDWDRGGIAAWKFFSFHFSGQEEDEKLNPLGHHWSLDSELPVGGFGGVDHVQDENNFYLGFSIEDICMKSQFVPFDERKKQAVLLFNSTSSHDQHTELTFSQSILDAAKADADVEFIVSPTSRHTSGVSVTATHEELTTTGRNDEFSRTLRESLLLVGGKDLPSSPIAYEALCAGVPFLNPIYSWNAKAPLDRTQWKVQHPGLLSYGPPRVYHVKWNDEAAFKIAVAEAVKTPIDRFIPLAMEAGAMQDRTRALVEGRWEGRAEELLEYRKTGGSGALFVL